MKKIFIVAVAVLAVFFMSTGVAFAQDDGGGFIKRMIDRFKKESPPAPAPVEEPAGFEPSEPPAPVPSAPAYPVSVDEESMMESVDLPEPEAAMVETTEPVPFQPAVPVAPPSKEELILEITETMEEDEEMLDIVQGFKRNTDESGNVYYTYLVDGAEKRMEELDTETLDKLSLRVRSEYNRLSSRRILDQLEVSRGAQRPPAAPQAPPSIVTPPFVPKAPSAYAPPNPPPAPPKAPSAPPGPPRK